MQMNLSEKGGALRRVILPLCVLFGTAFVSLLLCSKSSPLYGFNDWSDANWFFTVSRGIADGKIPYRDLFEQKGPVFYYVMALFTLASPTSMTGFFFAEVLAIGAFAVVGYRIFLRYLSPRLSLIGGAVLTVLTVTAWSFNQGGGAVEEYCLPLFAYGFYLFLRYFEDHELLRFRQMVVIGVMVGVIFWSKFLLALFFFFLMLLWLFDMIFVRREGKRAAVGMLGGTLGVLLVTLPVLIAFWGMGALREMLTVYLYDNMFLYSGVYENAAFGGAIDLPPLLIRAGFFFLNLIVDAVLAVGLVAYWREKGKTDRRAAVYMTVFLGAHVAEMLLIGYYSYYEQILSVFLPLGITPILRFVSGKLDARRAKRAPGKTGYAVRNAVLCGIALVYCFLLGNNTLELFQRDKYAQTQVADDIRETGAESPTLLAYKMVDRGFYRAAGVSPATRYFALNCYSRESYPEMYEELERYVREGETEFVVVYPAVYEEDKALFDRYEVVGEYEYEFYDCNLSHYPCEYLLLRLK